MEHSVACPHPAPVITAPQLITRLSRTGLWTHREPPMLAIWVTGSAAGGPPRGVVPHGVISLASSAEVGVLRSRARPERAPRPRAPTADPTGRRRRPRAVSRRGRGLEVRGGLGLPRAAWTWGLRAARTVLRRALGCVGSMGVDPLARRDAAPPQEPGATQGRARLRTHRPRRGCSGATALEVVSWAVATTRSPHFVANTIGSVASTHAAQSEATRDPSERSDLHPRRDVPAPRCAPAPRRDPRTS